MVQQFATEAANLVRAKEFATLPNAVGHVLDRHDIRQDRTGIMKQILSELGKRGARTKGMRSERGTIADAQRERVADQETAIAQIRQADMMRDARAHELRQPRSTYDPDHPENSP